MAEGSAFTVKKPQSLQEHLAAEAKRAVRDHLEKTFEFQLKAAGLAQGWIAEHKFHPSRKWRVDFANVAMKLAIEIEGGTHSNGRHNRAAGFEADSIKYNTLAAMGWTLFRFTGHLVTSGKAIKFVEDYLEGKKHAT